MPVSKHFLIVLFLLWIFYSHYLSIFVAAGQTADRWVERGRYVQSDDFDLGLYSNFKVIVFVTILHGLTPNIGIVLMNVFSAYIDVNLGIDVVFQALSLFKIAILLLIVIAGASVTIIFN